MYAKSPADHWKSKDTAIYLVTSLAAKKQTSKVFKLLLYLYNISRTLTDTSIPKLKSLLFPYYCFSEPDN